MKKIALTSLLILGFAPTANADSSAPAVISSDEVASCMRANLPEQTSSQEITLESGDRSGGKRSIDGRLFWNHSSDQTATMLKVDGPRDLAGGAYLSLKKPKGDELYMYIPALDKVRRLSGKSKSGQILGTDISYQDLEYLQGLAANNTVTVYGSDPIVGREAWKLEIVSNSPDSGNYERVESWVDKETCVSMKMDFYSTSSKLTKTLVGNPDTLLEVDSRWLLTEQTMTDIDAETNTVLTIHKVAYDPSISRQHFHKKRFFLAQ